MTSSSRKISIITPAFNEALNLPVLYQKISALGEQEGYSYEWLIIDDHSTDETFAVASAMAEEDSRVRAYRLSRNFGSHAAIFCGIEHASGDAAVVLAADLQDPPETIPKLIEKWKAGAQTVWAVREIRLGEHKSRVLTSNLYYWIMRKIVGIKDIPPSGADFFLLDRDVMTGILSFHERNMNILALITWMGFRQDLIFYVKEARLHGQSGWSLRKKFKLALDSILSFSALPIRAMFATGLIIASLGGLYGCIVLINSFLGHPAQGWSSLIIVVLVLGGTQLVMTSVLGEYLWKTLDETRRRPKYLVESSTEGATAVRKNIVSENFKYD